MSQNDLNMHYVCTLAQAQELVADHTQFWVSNCGCRESRPGCARSRLDLCLMFDPNDPGSGTGKHEVSLTAVQDIVQEAQEKRLVPRPFRDQTRTVTDGICFCCDDCCGYFIDQDEVCDKGGLIAETDFGICDNCGDCVEVCYFKARTMDGAELKVADEQCYGCGLCVDNCPSSCIQMVAREIETAF